MARDILDPVLVTLPHPLTSEGRELYAAFFLPSETLGEYVARNGVTLPRGTYRVQHNGHYVPQDLWTRLIPRTGDKILIHAVAGGGGGGGKVLRTVAMLALVIAAPYLGATIAGALGVTSSLGISALTAGVMIGGSLLINALLPPPRPLAVAATGKYETSPTYAISGGRNRMRPWEPMTLIFGQHKVVPDLGANYYVEYVGDDAYLNQVFHFGLQAGSVVLKDFKIGTTALENYQGVETQVSGTDGKLTLFAGNVDTLEGFVLDSGVVNARTTPTSTTHITVNLAATLFTVNDDGDIVNRSVDLRVQFRPHGSADPWTDMGLINNPIIATGYWAIMLQEDQWSGDEAHLVATERQIGYGSANPADHVDGDVEGGTPGYWAGPEGATWYPGNERLWRWVSPHPYTQGRPWRGIAPDPIIGYGSSPGVRLTGARTEPTRRTVEWDVSEGQYDIQIWKVTADVKDSRNSNEVAVSQILCFQTDPADYTGQLRVALRIKATAQLNGAVDEFSALAQAFAPVWDGTQYAPTFTRNPADWFLWFARGATINGRRAYGEGLPDSQIDLDALSAWRAWCIAKNLTFNYVLDQKMQADDVLQMIARAGRASVTRQTGKLGVVWDAGGKPVVAMFGPFNIRAGTFKVSYISDDTVDEIVLSFANEETDYTMDQVRASVPGATTTLNPIQLDLDGCTNADMAGREANLMAAAQVWFRRRTEWETDIEGWVAGRGDVVQMSHDLTVWGYSGRLTGRDGNDITLSQVIPQGSGTMMLRDPTGKMKVISVAGLAGETDSVTITSDMTGFALPGDAGFEDAETLDWAWFFDPLVTPGRRFKITEVTPTADGVKFSAVDDDPGYYASESNPYEHTPPRDGALLAGTVLDLVASEGYYNTVTRLVDVTVRWVLSTNVPVDLVYSINGTTHPAIRVEGTIATIARVKRGDSISITATPIAFVGAGAPKSLDYTVVGAAANPSQIADVTAAPDADRLQLRWRASPEPDVVDYEVRTVDSGWGDTQYVFKGDATECRVIPGEVGAPATWYVRAINAEGLYSETSGSVTYTVDALPEVSDITYTFFDTTETSATITLSWVGVQPDFGLDTYRVSYGASTQDVKATSVTLPAGWLGDRTFTIQTVDALGNVSAGAQVTVTKLAPAAPSGLFARVIDNNVLLFWTPPAPTTLPVSHTLLKSGPTWAAAQTIGIIKSGFASFSELEGGDHIYWFATVDTDGNMSDPVSLVASVAQPPDFVFRGEIVSDFSGAKTSAVIDHATLLLPVDTTATWATHFTGRSWTSPADQIAAGFPLFLQPTPTPGEYVETMDFGNVVPSSRVTLTLDAQTLAGTPVIATTIETSADGSAWSAPDHGADIFATNFRYVRVTLTVTQSGAEDALVRVNRLSVRLASKLKNDGDSVSVVSTDANGTIANFNVDFVDVASVTLTPAGPAARVAVYDFRDTVMSGTYSVASDIMTVSIAGHGLIAGQDVMLNLPGGSERVTIATASADSFTAPTTATGSGSLSAYPQSMRIYLFDTDGARVSGDVSWAVRGN